MRGTGMKVVIFGASGMVGMGTLLECLDDSRISSVLVIGRSSCGVQHAKLTEILQADFFDFVPIQARFADCDACFFCLGVSAAGMREDVYHHLTYDLTLGAARAILASGARLTFCYVSGEGTDSTERGGVMWARVKGKTENALLGLPFKASYMLRPGFIQPMRGVHSKTTLYHVLITLFRPLFPLLRRLFPQQTTTSVNMGRAMIHLAVEGDSNRVLRSADINRLAR
jgi:uncharacterized protein YbjT (DUF2867 family)